MLKQMAREYWLKADPTGDDHDWTDEDIEEAFRSGARAVLEEVQKWCDAPYEAMHPDAFASPNSHVCMAGTLRKHIESIFEEKK